ncbi:MAG TPA: right-handed parallel beta-helix repeat-containing protein [Chloroflexota bacterium]|nr:right-handed parallel beta-helix repeat-containing protein [Chloroflexota bacterium]
MLRIVYSMVIAASVALVLATAVPPSQVEAAAFTVNSANDETDAAPGDGQCRSASNACTLRAAIMEANARPGFDTITLPNGTFKLLLPGNDDASAVGDLDIADSLTITGTGPDRVIIDASALAPRDRVFDVRPNVEVDLTGLRITGGLAQSATTIGGQDGGGIRVMDRGVLELRNVVVNNNQALSVGGGMTVRTDASAFLYGSTIDNNSASLDGGGISTHRVSYLQLYSSTISRNRADRDGGGIRFLGQNFLADNSTISTNSAAGRGGGMFFDPPTGGSGYGYWVTVANNRAIAAGGGANIFSGSGGRGLTLRMSIVAGGLRGGNCGGKPVASSDYNLEDQNTCGFNAAHDIVNTNPSLGALRFDNSRTEVHPLPPTSPAVDVFDGCVDYRDQRGVTRPQDGNQNGTPRCDIGAYELKP